VCTVNGTANVFKPVESTFLNKKFEYEIHNKFIDITEHFSVLGLTFENIRFVLVIIHRPNSAKPDFYNDPFDVIYKNDNGSYSLDI
jgi:hypothetical protein